MENSVKRSFFLGDEWAYLKVYSGFKTCENLLINLIGPMLMEMKQKNLISKWFFIRYADPDYHLRFRFYLTDPKHTYELLRVLNKALMPYVHNRLIFKIQADTYHRELERYGYHNIPHSEDLFFYNSELSLRIIKRLKKEQLDSDRWIYSLLIVDSLLDAFGFDLKTKASFTKRMKESFYSEFKVDKVGRKMISARYRTFTQKIYNFLQRKENSPINTDIFNEIERIKQAMIPAINALIEAAENKTLYVDFENLVSSHVHMAVNRFYKTDQRQCELVLYDFLSRYYQSCIARNVQKKEGTLPI